MRLDPKSKHHARVDRSSEEKWQIVQEGIKSGNVSDTCRRHRIVPNLFYRWKDEAEQGAKAALGGRSAAATETEKDHRIQQPERTLGRKSGYYHYANNEALTAENGGGITLGDLFVECGVPGYIRSDNGSEFTAKLIECARN